MMKFGYTILYVPDVVKAIEFYEKAFGFERKFIAPGNEYGELATGATTLSFAAASLVATFLGDGYTQSDPKGKPFGIEVGFTTDNVEKSFEDAVKAGAVAVSKPETKPWGQTVSYVRDLNGFLVEICSPIEM